MTERNTVAISTMAWAGRMAFLLTDLTATPRRCHFLTTSSVTPLKMAGHVDDAKRNTRALVHPSRSLTA